MTSKQTKIKKAKLEGRYATSNSQVIIEGWEIQEKIIKNADKGLSAFLKKVDGK